jgi:hypothetical protein
MCEQRLDIRIGVGESPPPAAPAQIRKPLQDLVLDGALDAWLLA